MEKEIETKCGLCDRMTHQKVLYSKKQVKQVDENGWFEIHALYMVVQCGGCKPISFLLKASDLTPYSDKPEYEDHNYPV